MSNLPLRDRVLAGIELLDRKGPADWRDKINLNRLNMLSRSSCVLGQVFGHYNDGLVSLGLAPGTAWDDYEGTPYGFMIDKVAPDMSFDDETRVGLALLAEWLAELQP